MTQLQDVQKFIELSQEIASPADLDQLLSDISAEMGFDHFALMHHVDLTPFSHELDHMVRGQLIALSNYPESWIEHFILSDLVVSDPMVLASHRSNVGFTWDKVPKLIDMTDHHRAITEAARGFGLEDGFTVPANVPGEANGSVNFAIGPNKLLPEANLPMAQLVGSFAFQAARDLVRRSSPHSRKPTTLTQRQLDCLVWVARGKTDWEIGKILGISEETVTEHINSARARYDVGKRVQAVLRAVFDGQIPLTDLLK